MTMTYALNKESLYHAIVSGAQAVIKKTSILNEINVFPVKDSDTGTNMAALMLSVLENSKIKNSLKETLKTVSDAALVGSRGNSGMIFSQFIYGFAKDIQTDVIDIDIFIKHIELGYQSAFNAIQVPVEGTMITLMRNFHQLLLERKNDYNDPVIYFKDINKQLKEALLQTKEQLKILKKYNVVDAGAMAFTIFMDAFIHSILDENTVEETEFEYVHKPRNLGLEHEEVPNYRYCTELLLETTSDSQTIKNRVKSLGDALVVGVSSNYIKLHIHTNTPHVVAQNMIDIAKIKESKVDDMLYQYRLNHEALNDICILTDSVADIKGELIDEAMIDVYPLSLLLNTNNYLDKRTINNQTLLAQMKTSDTFPQSTSPNMIKVIEHLEYLKIYYKKIIILSVSSKMSSTHNIFKNAVDRLQTKDIVLIDTLNNSVSQGLIVYEASKLIKEDLPFNQVLRQIQKFIDQTTILVQVNTLDQMVKGGRISKGLGVVAKLINLKPLVSIDKAGVGTVYKKTIGYKRSYKKLLKHIKNTHQKQNITTYAIAHVLNIKGAEKLKKDMIDILGFKPAYVTESSSIIAMNAGLGALAISYMVQGDKS